MKTRLGRTLLLLVLGVVPGVRSFLAPTRRRGVVGSALQVSLGESKELERLQRIVAGKADVCAIREQAVEKLAAELERAQAAAETARRELGAAKRSLSREEGAVGAKERLSKNSRAAAAVPIAASFVAAVRTRETDAAAAKFRATAARRREAKAEAAKVDERRTLDEAKRLLEKAEEREAFGASHYETLGVPRNATARELKAGYRRSAAACHPDADGSEFGAARFERVKLAYGVLGDEASKRSYDRELGLDAFIDDGVVPFARRGATRAVL